MSQTTDRPIREIGPAEARRLLDGGALALDVREPEEFAAGHVAGARLLPLGRLPTGLADLPRDRTIVVVCRSGRRSGEAVRTMQRAGFDDARNLAGGMLAWREAGLPVEA
jgi:rhodanese-related sulfurtransferase